MHRKRKRVRWGTWKIHRGQRFVPSSLNFPSFWLLLTPGAWPPPENIQWPFQVLYLARFRCLATAGQQLAVFPLSGDQRSAYLLPLRWTVRIFLERITGAKNPVLENVVG